MEGREERDPGYDDWFDEPEPPTETQTGAGRGVYDDADEVWVVPEEEAERTRGRRGEIVIAGRTLTTTQVVILAVSVLAIFFAILAAVGVFSGGKAPVPPVTTPPPPTNTTPTTTTPTITTPAAQAPSQTLKPGDTGSQVKILQQALASLGYSPGKVDGDYGPSTQAAVEQFQKAKGLTVDGIVGPQTLAKLQAELSG
jgi:Putative peptidoglycan binding domain